MEFTVFLSHFIVPPGLFYHPYFNEFLFKGQLSRLLQGFCAILQSCISISESKNANNMATWLYISVCTSSNILWEMDEYFEDAENEQNN